MLKCIRSKTSSWRWEKGERRRKGKIKTELNSLTQCRTVCERWGRDFGALFSFGQCKMIISVYNVKANMMPTWNKTITDSNTWKIICLHLDKQKCLWYNELSPSQYPATKYNTFHRADSWQSLSLNRGNTLEV